jgi:hypothetical protein
MRPRKIDVEISLVKAGDRENFFQPWERRVETMMAKVQTPGKSTKKRGRFVAAS